MKENDKDMDLKEELEHMNPIFKELKDRPGGVKYIWRMRKRIMVDFPIPP